MKQLETNFTLDNHHFTQIKRNDKAAMYRRETTDGHFVSFEVFMLMTKDGAEIYPNQKAVVNKWCFCPVAESRANIWFDRITNGDIPVPSVDPVTGEHIESEISTLPDEPVSVETPVAEVLPEVSTVETPVDPLHTEKVVAEVVTTPDKGAAVVVAKVKNDKVYVIPTGEFTQAGFANANGLPERGIVWSILDKLVKSGKLSKELRKMGRGRPSQVFKEIGAV
jgi:hypothetical protein